MIVFLVSSIALFIVLIVFLAKLSQGRRYLLSKFSSCNCIVFGKKGTGKDLIFNFVINHRKKPCFSNVQFNQKYCKSAKIGDFSCRPLTYSNFISGNISPIEKHITENCDMYISDGGIALPSQYHGDLDKIYPSLPIFYALSRHLGNLNIHINTQNLTRVWDKLREQADAYFKTRWSLKIGPFIFTSFIYYEEYEAAKSSVRPYPIKLFFAKAESKANFEQFLATHGEVKKLLICQRVKDIHYDTRIFHNIVYGFPAPIKSKIAGQRSESDNVVNVQSHDPESTN